MFQQTGTAASRMPERPAAWPRTTLIIPIGTQGKVSSARTCVAAISRDHGLPGAILPDNGVPFASSAWLPE